MSLPRAHLAIVIDGLSKQQLADLGQQFSQLPTPPNITLITTVPILNKVHSEEKQVQARKDLALAAEILHYPAATKIVEGSMNAEKFFIQGSFDALFKKQGGQLTISVKNFWATGIHELSNSLPVTDLSEHKSLPHSYKGIFAKSQASTINEENKLAVSPQHDSPKPKL